MNDLTRRGFLKFIGAPSAIATLGPFATLREAQPRANASGTFARSIELLRADGSGGFPQNRTVPVGSQWPGNIAKSPSDVGRPAVIGIQRKHRSWREHWEHDRRDDDDDD
jgi:hypothetical protein